MTTPLLYVVPKKQKALSPEAARLEAYFSIPEQNHLAYDLEVELKKAILPVLEQFAYQNELRIPMRTPAQRQALYAIAGREIANFIQTASTK